MTDQVRRFDGTVAQLVGDGMLALFGVAGRARGRRRARRPRGARDPARARAVRARGGGRLRRRAGGPRRRQHGPGRRGLDGTATTAATLQRARRHRERRRPPPGDRRRRRRRHRPDDEAPDRDARSSSSRSASWSSRASAEPLDTFRVTRVLERSRSPPSLPLVGRDFELHRARAHDGRARRGARRDRLDHGRARDRQDAARLGGARPLPRPRPLHRGARRLLRARPSPTGRSATCCASGSASAPPTRRPGSASS